MSSFNTYLSKIQDLTDKNLQILTLLNSAFYSKNEHVSAIVGDSTYTIPSFLHIENKLNDLDGNWKRLVNSPLQGEASFVLDGNTRKIQIAGYETSPKPISSLTPTSTSQLYVESNDIFKDFITPIVSVRFVLDSIGSETHEVNVRKVTFRSEELQSWMDSMGDDTSAMKGVDWQTVGAKLEGYTDGVDYVLYDKIYRLPLTVNDYNGQFVMKSVSVDQDGSNIYWNGVIDGYTYTYDEGKMTADLKVGDLLLTEGNGCKLVVSDIDYNARTITLRVVSGYYAPRETNTLTLFVPDEKKSKIISVPLEEDTHIAVFISPINSSLNTTASWAGGQLIWTDRLQYNGQPFREVYNGMVKNLGDILNDITSFINGSLSSLTEAEVNTLTSVKPALKPASDSESGDYDVVLLNDHLLDNATVETLRVLNNEKAAISAELQVISNQIQLLKSELSATDLSDQVATYREDLQKRLDDYNTKSVSKTTELINKINEISQLASNTVLPGKGSKYVIRGAVPTSVLESAVKGAGAKVIKIEILYRYKNINKATSNATAISDALTVGDWNKYIIDRRQKIARWDIDKRTLVYEYESEVGDDNTAAQWRTFNIPIQQGETVDFRCRVIWDLGWPYVSVTSGWCDVKNVEFPEDLVEYADVSTIISNNNADAEDNTVRQEMLTAGVTEHINDEVIDQDQTYFHRPESISSGFYTDDSRRVIPLSAKLREMSDDIDIIKNGAFANSSKNLKVTISDEYNSLVLSPDAVNVFRLPAWGDISDEDSREASSGSETSKTTVKTHVINIVLENNNQSSPLNLYSMFPGNVDTVLKDYTYTKFDKNQYLNVIKNTAGDIMNIINLACMNPLNNKFDSDDVVNEDYAQRCGQILYFRGCDKWQNDYSLYGYFVRDTTLANPSNTQMSVLCTPGSWDNIRTLSNEPGSAFELPGGTAVMVPLSISLTEPSENTVKTKTRTVAFDVWTSPFSDPMTYIIKFIASTNNRGIKRLTDSQKNSTYSPIIRKPINSTGRTTVISPRIATVNNNA